MAELNFNAAEVAPDEGFGVVPADWYDLMVTDSDVTPTKDGTGTRLKVTYTIQTGAHVNKKIFGAFNIVNKNPEAQKIALGQLSALAHAVGVLQVRTTENLHGIVFKGRVKIRKDRTGEYDDQNEITAFKPHNDPQPTNTAGAGVMTAPGMVNQQATPGWAAQAAPVSQPAAFPAQGFAQQAAPQAGFGQQPQQAAQQPAAQGWQAPAGQQAWANGQPSQPAAAGQQAAATQPQVPASPAVQAAQQLQPAFIDPNTQTQQISQADPQQFQQAQQQAQQQQVQSPAAQAVQQPAVQQVAAQQPAAGVKPSWAQ